MATQAEKRNAEYIAPAHSAEGQTCIQCSKKAWHVELVPFCRDHDQKTLQKKNRTKRKTD